MNNAARTPPAPSSSRGSSPAALVLLAGGWIASIGNLALWRHLAALPEMHNPRGAVFALAMFALIAGGSCAVLALLNWRWLLKPAVCFFVLAAAIGAYFMLAFGVVLDPTMMTNVVQTSTAEAGDLLGWRFFALVLGLGVLPALCVWRLPLRAVPFGRRALRNAGLLLGALAVMAVAVLAMFQDFSSLMRNHPQLRYEINPFNSIFSLVVVKLEPYTARNETLVPIGHDARLGSSYAAQARPPLLVLVLGETARAANFEVDGYARATTPRLAELNAGARIASQRDAWSCGTNTAASLPCMFSHQGRSAHDARSASYENLLDVLQHAGLAVLWIDNQSGCKGVCDRVPNVSTETLTDPAYCADGECFDEIMLQQLDAQIAKLPPARTARGVVVVLHQMGSHGPAYFRRSPPAFKKFLPECEQAALQSCTHEQLVNAYDNSIVYTDHFLFSAIDWIERASDRFDGALLYLSDHGESLGENRMYLHGLPYRVAPDVQKHIPWITWLSKAFQARLSMPMACLRSRTELPISHDNYFHSALGLMDVQTDVYEPKLDFYRPCRLAARP